MPQTPISDSSAYATVADLQARFDTRDLAQWASDTGTPIASGSLATNPALLAMLSDASGIVELACLVGERYSVSDLQTLAAATGNSSAILKRIVCDLAVGMLIERRPFLEREPMQQYLHALDMLQEIRAGKRIFAFIESAQAGNPKDVIDSNLDIDYRNLTTNQASRYFGIDRANRYRPGGTTGAGANVVP